MEKYSMICRAVEISGERISYQSLPFGKSRIRVLTFDGTPTRCKTSPIPLSALSAPSELSAFPSNSCLAKGVQK